MHVLDLAGGGASLEFAPEHAAEVIQSLHRFGPVQRTQGAVHDVIEVSNEQIIFYSDWDEPCLIASSVRGVAILRQLAAELAHPRAA